ncbi:MAG: 30S ribosomal protein S12 methylthiotransferase RimO, partial [Candidatus Pacebacteria bacterium]|nr:30S ribosomal protein S12 methylthiotransferase RimO [Candidatus Paceibacterota bacterium]
IEDSTLSYNMGDPVSEEEKNQRKDTLLEIQKEISLKKNQSLVGKNLKIIVDRIEGEFYIGRSEKDAPEVDGEVLIPLKENNLEVGEFYYTEIYDCNEYDLFGKL